jgi:hypothetical protein
MRGQESDQEPSRPWYGALWHQTWTSLVTVGFGVLAAVLLTPWIQTTLVEPGCDDPDDLSLVARSEMTATATGENPPEQGATYEPALAIDGDSSTAWVEGIPDGDANKYGEGETLTITLDRSRDVHLVCIINGYTNTQTNYLHNARVRQLTVATDAGRPTDSVLPDKTLEFFAAYQPVNITKGRTSTIAITIGTARAGQDSTQETDTAISEVEVWAKGD